MHSIERETVTTWELWSEKNSQLVEKARTNLESLSRQELSAIFENVLLDILLAMTPDSAIRQLEVLGVSRETARYFQGKIGAGTFSPMVDLFQYYETIRQIVQTGQLINLKHEAKIVVTNIVNYSFADHPYWSAP